MTYIATPARWSSATADAGFDTGQVYLTNAVKHFKFRAMQRGKRRVHEKPDRDEILACRPWLVQEIRQVRPELVVVLGATAAQALLGPAFRVTKARGLLLPWPDSADHPEDFPDTDAYLLPTVHPSSVLRADDRQGAYAELVADLRTGSRALRP